MSGFRIDANFELLVQKFFTTKYPFNYFYFLSNKLHLFGGMHKFYQVFDKTDNIILSWKLGFEPREFRK